MIRAKKIRNSTWVIVAMVVGISFNMREGWSSEHEDDVPWEQVYQHTARSFVIVNYHLKKSDRPLDDDRSGSRYGSQDVLQRILNKNTAQSFGVIISSEGEVFTNDAYQYIPDTIDRISVSGPDGVEMPIHPDRLLLKTPGKVLRIEGGLPAEWKALDFVELGEVSSKTKLFAVTLMSDEHHPIYVGPCRYRINWSNVAGRGESLQIPSVNAVAIICDEQGRPVGVVNHSQIDLTPKGLAWRGKDILADEGISTEQQKQLEEQLEHNFANNVYEIKVTFRPVPKEEEEFDYGPRFSYRGYELGGSSSRELNLYGLGFVEDKLLIPGALQREQIEGIDTISVNVDDKQVPARFCGVMAQCSAMVVELQEGRLPRTMTFLANGKLSRYEPFWAVFVRELAGKNALVEHTRWISRQQAFADKWYPVSQRPIPVNSWLIDRQGRLIGLFCEARHEYDRIKQYLLGSQYNRFRGYRSSSNQMRRSKGPQQHYGYGSEDIRLFESVQLADMLSELPDNYDTRIRHLDKDQQRRRVWLGVEYTHLDKEMVKQMDLRDQTQDGRIGLMVNRIYPGSPAARLGLAEGNVLLEIAVDGLPWPIELMPDKREDYDMPDFEDVDIPKEFEAMGFRMPRKRPWRSRDNYLTRMLDDIGVGTTVKLSYIQAGETVQKEFVVEQSPPDMLSAAKYKTDKLGLTVKDLTYEVRAALHLGEDDVAVVVAQVEQGKPAALARIELYELIRAVDGVQVNSVESFEKLITEAQQANKPSVRLTVEWIGKTRLADLKFEAKGASGVLKSLIPGL